MPNEKMEATPETIKAEIKEMVTNYPHFVVEVMIEMVDYIIDNADELAIQALYDELMKRGM